MSDSDASRDQKFVTSLLEAAPEIEPYEASGPLLEQLIDNIIADSLSLSSEGLQKFKDKLFDSFVDWNEIRLVAADRLRPFFGENQSGEYSRKVLQALLNKIFSRGGSLDHQFLMDFEAEDLEDYLAGIMEMQENTRKRLLLRVFKKPVSPITTEHEVIFEKASIEHVPGSEEMKALFSSMSTLDLERIQAVLDLIVKENGGSDGAFIDAEDFKSPTLEKILKKI